MTRRAVILLACALAGSTCGRSRTVDDAALRQADADTDNWLTYGRTYSEQRFSSLQEVDERTVTRLGLAWSRDLGTLRALESTPIVDNGVMYVTSAWSLVYALDARTGRELWTFDPHVPKDHSKFVCCDVVNRGVALYKSHIYLGTLDGRLIALDARTGSRVWEVQTTPKGGPYSITGAPRIARGRVIIGNAGSEYAVRGYISAYDADTGALAWRTYMVPGDPSKPFESEALRRAAATWSGEWWKLGGGGSVWDTIVYDPDLDFVFVGTANGSPWYSDLRGDRRGDNLYVASIVALRATSGEQVWHFQTTPGDSWDFDATQPLLLADLTIAGQLRRVILQANKNGFFYVLDRQNGQMVSATPFVGVTWATGIDGAGRPIESAEARAEKDAAVVAPWTDGAHNWHPISFNPRTGLVYLSATDAAQAHAVDRAFVPDVHDQTIGRDARYKGPAFAAAAAAQTRGRLVAWDPVNKREAWHVDQPAPKSGGTLTTAGNLVFQGRADGRLAAYRATDGTTLWQFDAGVGIAAPPMTYRVDGTQYVAVVAGWGGPTVLLNLPAGRGKVGFGQLLVFALDGKAPLPRYERVVGTVPLPEFQLPSSAHDVDEGGALYVTYCRRCHGADAASGGSVPDLRFAQTSTHRDFDAIVRGGARRDFGMPSFADDLTAEQARLIHAYVLDRTRASAGR